MARPGPIRFAENDLYAIGPSVGSPTKLEPPQTYRDDGEVPGYQPSPDVWNWLLNRLGREQEESARRLLMSWRIRRTITPANPNQAVKASCHVSSGDADWFLHDGATIREKTSPLHRSIITPTNPLVVAATGSFAETDAASDGTARCVVAVDSGATDKVWESPSIGTAWSAISGGSAMNWYCIDCDRGVTPRWLIAGYAGAIMRVATTTNLAAGFSTVTSAPSLTEIPRALIHTRHPAGIVDYSDAGNPLWVILGNTRLMTSPDAVNWTLRTHGFTTGGVNLGPRSIAYSKTARRFVAVVKNGAGAGDIYYSDDNCATWTYLPGVLPGAVGTHTLEIASDGWGGFVVNDPLSDSLWISSDEGEHWTEVGVDYASENTRRVEACVEDTLAVGGHAGYEQRFCLLCSYSGGSSITLQTTKGW